MTKFKKNTSLSLPLSLSLSLLVDLSMHFDFPEMMCMYQSLSLSLSIYLCKNGLDPDQTRMEFKKECFVNLKICACDRKYAKCRTKAEAHDKMDFQYISISEYIVRSHARIQNGDRGSGPLSNTRSNPLKFSEQPSQHSTLGHHRHASETPFKGVSLAGWWPAFSDIWILFPLKKKKKNVVRVRIQIRSERNSGKNVSSI